MPHKTKDQVYYFLDYLLTVLTFREYHQIRNSLRVPKIINTEEIECATGVEK